MKFSLVTIKIFFILTVLQVLTLPVSAMDDPGFTISRMETCESISSREPNGISDTFSVDTERVYAFLEAKNIEFDTEVIFVWYLGGQEMARVNIPLQKGKRWRTYSSKKLAYLNGNWKVELLDASGIVLNTISFQVQ